MRRTKQNKRIKQRKIIYKSRHTICFKKKKNNNYWSHIVIDALLKKSYYFKHNLSFKHLYKKCIVLIIESDRIGRFHPNLVQ